MKWMQEKVERDVWRGKGHWEEETGEKGTRGYGKERRGEMKGPEDVLRWKRRGEPQQTCIGETTNETHPFTKQNSFCCFSHFILLAKCWHSPALPSRKARAAFPVCVWQGGSWGLKFSRSRSEAFLWWRNVAVCCCVLPASWKHISGLSSARFLLDQSGFPLLSISTFPRSIAQTHTRCRTEEK